MNRKEFIVTEHQGATKTQSLLDSLTTAIENGRYQAGDLLPSVNELSRLSGFSKDTVVKAYRLLKERSLAESVPAKGFFVAGNTGKIFMLLDDFSAFKEQLYRSFRENIPRSWTVDLLFHHYNPDIFEQLVLNAAGRYSMYVIMNISNKSLHPVLSRIDPKKLLVLDMGSAGNEAISFLLQNFGDAVMQCFEKSLPVMKKYHEIIMIYSHQKTPHPPETVDSVRKFCHTYGFGFSLQSGFSEENLRSGQLYFVIKEDDLVDVVRSCRQKNLLLGREVGVLAYNDTPMKEIAGNGISSVSVNFGEMGKKAAGFITNRRKIQEILPTSLILRSSL